MFVTFIKIKTQSAQWNWQGKRLFINSKYETELCWQYFLFVKYSGGHHNLYRCKTLNIYLKCCSKCKSRDSFENCSSWVFQIWLRFDWDKGWSLKFQNFVFGNNNLKSSPNSKSKVSFEICSFWGFQNWPYFWYLAK